MRDKIIRHLGELMLMNIEMEDALERGNNGVARLHDLIAAAVSTGDFSELEREPGVIDRLKALGEARGS